MILSLVLVLVVRMSGVALAQEDPRSFMHGIGAVPDRRGGAWIFFSSSGLPPHGEQSDEEWTHSIYVGDWSGDDGLLHPKKFINKPPAQEPVSVAETDDGHIMVLTEDGWDSENEVDERYAIYDAQLKTIRRYPQTAADGGHSGHVAASGNLFVVTYSENWVDGGGVDGLGSGKGVYVKIYDSKGRERHAIPLAPHKREWWPIVAASPNSAIIVWQSFIKNETFARLNFAVLDPRSGSVKTQQILRDDVQYYTYSVHYIADINRFIIAGTSKNGRGFAYLLDDKGHVSATVACMPAIEREAGIAVADGAVYVPSGDNRLLRLTATQTSLALTSTAPSPLTWSTTGSIGLPNKHGGLHWFSLAKTGLQEADFNEKTFAGPTNQDLCFDRMGNPP
jgi:hypothetical protein